MKKLKKLAIRKITLRDLDEPTMGAVAGAGKTVTCAATCANTCVHTCVDCIIHTQTCCKTSCF